MTPELLLAGMYVAVGVLVTFVAMHIRRQEIGAWTETGDWYALPLVIVLWPFMMLALWSSR